MPWVFRSKIIISRPTKVRALKIAINNYTKAKVLLSTSPSNGKEGNKVKQEKPFRKQPNDGKISTEDFLRIPPLTPHKMIIVSFSKSPVIFKEQIYIGKQLKNDSTSRKIQKYN